ncbi:MAG TPA: rhomboid family intramembrane serine protease [Steroidobacteraceae bacterium]|jgi:membrane associated rhomboid family serine protease|nr:rhomboid family intramembrane serine protease [Steroidobacteraceae bacterium]
MDPGSATVFRGPLPRCRELSLVLEARGIEHDFLQRGDAWVIEVAPPLASRAYDELTRYAAEAGPPRGAARVQALFAGAAPASLGYVMVLVLTAYCAGVNLFGADWVAVGALDAAVPGQWWRAFTALTLHVEQEHLLGNLLFGTVAGIAAGRLLGPGIAWASVLGAGVFANLMEMLIAPSDTRAIGASTAVFAALGILSGLAWRQRLSRRERSWYAVAPLIAGLCLLTLLGAGGAHVDVLGHGLGFLSGLGLGWLYARARIPRDRSRTPQVAAGAGAVLAVIAAWALALTRGG